jgi:hypothetical protein
MTNHRFDDGKDCAGPKGSGTQSTQLRNTIGLGRKQKTLSAAYSKRRRTLLISIQYTR